ADHERDRHGLAQSAPQSQHDAADYAAFRVRQNDLPYYFPCRAAQAVGRFLEQRGYEFKDVPHDGRNEWNYHNRQNEACREYAYAERRTGEYVAQHRNAFEKINDMWLNILLEYRHKHE